MPGPFVRYELGERLGAGGMAEVFRARAVRYDGSVQDVVVKRILPRLSDDLTFKAQFLDEATIASRLDHPAVVRFLDFGTMDGQLFLTLELVDGPDVGRLLRALVQRGE